MKYWMALLIYLALLFSRSRVQFQARANLDKMVGREIRLDGKVSSEPILQGSRQKLKIGNMEVVVGSYPKYEYGQRVRISGTLQRQVVNKYVTRFRLIYPRVKILKPDSVFFIGLDWRKMVYSFRDKIEDVYNQTLPEPEASLLAGVVLGVKRSLPYEFWQSLQKTGTLHIVVASGYNITIVIGVTVGLLAGIFRRQVAILIGLFVAVLYTVMAGAEPAIVRAAIMGAVAFGSQLTGRQADGVRSLIAAGALMLLYSPQVIYDVGFQLSVMATLGLILIGPVVGKYLEAFGDWGSDVRDSLSAQVMVWPIILINFNSISAFSLLVNALILWLVPLVMTLGAGLAVVGLVNIGLARVFGWVVYLPLTVIVRVVEWFGSQSFISYQVDGVSSWWMLGYYLMLSLLYLRWITKHGHRLNSMP